MATLAQVLAWRPDALDVAGDGLTRDRRGLLDLQDEIDESAVPRRWTGDAAQAARAHHRVLRLELNDHVATLSSVCGAVDAAAGAVRRAQEQLHAALADAATQDFTVDRASGAVRDNRTTYADEQEAADRRRLLAALVDHLEQGLRAAEHADEELAAALRVGVQGIEGGAGDLASASAAGAGDARPDVMPPPRGGSMHDWAAWFGSLSREQQEWVTDHHPDWIGNRDGIPAWARDDANRNLLDDHERRLRQQLEDLGPAPDPFHDPLGHLAWQQRHESVTGKLEGLGTISQLLELRGEQYQLLLVDPTDTHQLKAALGVGDVDAADNVTVFTPGLTSTVQGSLPHYTEDMEALVYAAERHGGSTAAVAWFGYEAPQLDETVLTERSVALDDLARAGSDDLAAFYNGVDASREQDPHLTALGHSYGSLTTGLALQHSTGVDGAVFFGSPGIGAESLDQLDIPEDRAFSISSSTDPVAHLNHFGTDPDLMDGITRLDAAGDRVTSGGEELDRSGGHTRYLDLGTTGQHNLAAVVAGADAQLLHDDNPTLVDEVVDGSRELVGDALDGAQELADDAGDWLGRLVR